MGAAYLMTRERMLLADDPGLGKTVQALVAINTIASWSPKWPDVLVVCPKNAIGVWETMAEEWLGIKPRTYVAGKAKYSDITAKGGMLITNYEQLGDIYKRRQFFPIVIFDESHKIRNHKTKMYKAAKYFSAHWLWFMTGTPVFKGAQDLWSTLAMIAPNEFPAYWPFVNKYCITSQGWGGSKQAWGVRNPPELARDIAPYFLRRKRTEVLKDLPEKFRFKVPLHMTPVQKAAYVGLYKQMMLEMEEDVLLIPSAAVRTLRLRELLVSPRILGIDDDGAAIPNLLEKLEERGTPSLVYTPFREGVRLIKEYVRAAGWETNELMGGLPDKVITAEVEKFQKGKNPKRILISTVQMGTSWTGTAAQQTWFVGYDWAPQINVQAEDRMNRYGGNGYECGYFTHMGTVDEHVMEVLSGKITVENLIINHKYLLDMGRI
jgi:SNF2 family DNA or RNA helicase